MISHGALRHADSIERTAQICPPSHSDQERHVARAEPSARGRQTSGQAKPGKAVRPRGRARGRRAALRGSGWAPEAYQTWSETSCPFESPRTKCGVVAV